MSLEIYDQIKITNKCFRAQRNLEKFIMIKIQKIYPAKPQ